MKRAAFLLIPLLAGLPLPALADCQAIVERTVAELRAAYPGWDERMETLARTAAGSACVKATHPANSATAPQGKVSTTENSTMTSAAVAAAGPASDAGGDEESGDPEAAAGKDDESWTPFKDLKFNNVSSRPGKKPYERRREVNDTE